MKIGDMEIEPEEIVIFLRFLNKLKKLFKKKVTKLEAKILFIDDEEFPVVDNLKESNWDVKRIPDVTDLDCEDIKRAHIIFVDYKGVGKSLARGEEGIGIIKALMEKYKNSKRIILYSGHSNFTLGKHLQAAHNQMAKNSDVYEFITMIESELKKL